MSQSNLLHHYIDNPALAYVPTSSATSKDVQWIDGNNVLTSIKGYSELRPGFSAQTADVFSQGIQRFFTFQKWSGAYYVICNIVGGGQSLVYKQKVGTDAAYVLLFTSSSAVPFDFVFTNNYLFMGNGTDMRKWDGTSGSTDLWGIVAPASALTINAGSGSLSPTVGYQYVMCWFNTTTGHISSPSPISATTGPGSSQHYVLTGNTTTDPQVSHAKVYRSVDGGSIFYELPNSPVVYATWVSSGLTDNAADPGNPAPVLSSISTAPLPNMNNPPTPSQGCAWFAGRVWTCAGDTVYYSGLEEIPLSTGVSEECFPSINQYSFGKQVQGLATTDQFLIIFTANTIFRIYGDQLTTFRRDTLANGLGCRNQAAVASTGRIVAWLDATNTVQMTDGVNIQEISKAIRVDIASITQSTAQLTFYNNGVNHWLVLMDAGSGKLRVFDQDTGQWMPPWSVSGVTAIRNGETAAAAYQLFLGRNKKPLQVGIGSYGDEGVNYSAYAVTNLFDITQDSPYMDRLSETDKGGFTNPTQIGSVDHIELETNAVTLSDVKYLVDEDPANGTYRSIAANVQDPPRRRQGAALLEKWYMQNTPGCRRQSIRFEWAAGASNFKLYGFAVAYKVVA